MRAALPCGILVAAWLAASPGVARAQSDVAVRDAQARFEEGLERVKSGDFEAARLSFAQAYAVLRRPSILWNLALAEEKTGFVVDALSHFKQVARDSEATASDREVAQRHATALMARTGHIAVEAAAGATLSVDGKPTDAVAPLAEPLDVAPGHHVIEARLGPASKTLEVDAAAGQEAHVNFVVADASVPAPPSPTGPQGASSAPPPYLPETPSPSSPAPSTPRVAAVAALGGAALVAVAVGVYLGIKSQHDADRASQLRQDAGNASNSCVGGPASASCSDLDQTVHDQDREAIASDALYVTAGVLAAGAVAAWFLWPKRAASHAAAVETRVSPIVSPTTVGLNAILRF
jgi:hypothetical protein